jgi:hypothetical protein
MVGEDESPRFWGIVGLSDHPRTLMQGQAMQK